MENELFLNLVVLLYILSQMEKGNNSVTGVGAAIGNVCNDWSMRSPW